MLTYFYVSFVVLFSRQLRVGRFITVFTFFVCGSLHSSNLAQCNKAYIHGANIYNLKVTQNKYKIVVRLTKFVNEKNSRRKI